MSQTTSTNVDLSQIDDEKKLRTAEKKLAFLKANKKRILGFYREFFRFCAEVHGEIEGELGR